MPPSKLPPCIKRYKNISKELSDKFGGIWKYNGYCWMCDDDIRLAMRGCSCYSDDDECNCDRAIRVYDGAAITKLL